MKTSTLPAVRVTPEVRALAESVLRKGETLSMFIEDSLKQKAQWRKDDAEFYARGFASGQRARETGVYVSEETVMEKLHSMLAAKKKAFASQHSSERRVA